MKTAPKKLFLLLSTLLLLSLLLLAGCGQTAPTPEPEDAETANIEPVEIEEDLEPGTLGHYADYPVTSDPADMFRQSTAVVIGRYSDLEETWNMARNPEDPSQESKTDYFEGRIYPFTVERVIKGNLEPGPIRINTPYERQVKGNLYFFSGPDGEAIENPEPEPYSFTYIWEYFMEPDPTEPYLLFLNHNEESGRYYPAVEPYTIAIGEGDRLELRSNLLLPEAERKERLEIPFVTERGRDMVYEIHGDEIEDRISGMTLDEFLAELERAAQDPEPVQPE